MSSKNTDNQESLISASLSEDEVTLYVYWKVLVKRKKIFLGIFLVPLVITIIISLVMPRYYRGESEISIPAPAPNTPVAITAYSIVNLIGNVDDAKKVKIFASNSSAIKSVLISLPKKSTDKVSIIIDAKTADILPEAFKNIFDYISNLPEIKGSIAALQSENDLKTERLIEETDYKIKKLVEVKNANLTFLNDMSDMIKKRKLPVVNINPADLIEKDAKISLEIKNLEQVRSDAIKKKESNVKVTAGILGPPSITQQPANEKIKQIIIIVALLSFLAAIFVVFSLEYIEKMKARENKSNQ
ncbi:MAG: hypothetical protein CVU52_02570 [Deltaproteobacteria bacterium HGW-Deltaproteobacteria-10]|nr:MAG: hypothetical protein CVU52_02570 [Deltaproteobacteria bacterium HGW-Deltaproteobacteria-10]